ncbi:prepilin-type N-terminal cleavage/methylation domain-containing protein [Bacterioplanoides sp. SCSIO 12839]|uniref:type IV pilus modification PilV family protein n=1 Tax=Bacterioplanoides sp. SCSIO 12839 TaxID=2829569 RepID=UPI002102DAA3|nr:type II secretion system protein [Bacterioplanoides sp. SCSIO 12839]UTW47608.1 type II secretion system protein [Bacterioplanoides sp. SCSIO 12839]
MKEAAFYNLQSLRRVDGVTLVELVISIVVISIALTALLSSFSLSAGRSADPMWQSKASQLAQAYLDEIMAMRFQENSPLAGGAVVGCSVAGNEADETSRALFDDVDDYDGLNEQASFLDNTVPTSYVGYQVAVNVSCSDAAGNTGSSVNSKLITLNITSPTGQTLSFSTFRGNF